MAHYDFRRAGLSPEFVPSSDFLNAVLTRWQDSGPRLLKSRPTSHFLFTALNSFALLSYEAPRKA
jgi:hypothetical protein